MCDCCVGLFGLHIWVIRFLIVCIESSWLGYLEGEISGVLFFFQLVASFLVELEVTVMVVVVWLCRDVVVGFIFMVVG